MISAACEAIFRRLAPPLVTAGARRRAEPELPPLFAVDLLIAKIPIEMGRQGRAHSPSIDGRLSTPYGRAASGGRDP
jgi:hypothetical protein